jgi:predicted DNA-binding mobile mystery protein A
MEHLEQSLKIEQMDRKISLLVPLLAEQMPADGWVHSIRTSLKMSIRQLAARLHMKPPPLKQLELREKQGAVTLKSLNDIAASLNMKFVYGFVPKEGSLIKMIEDRASLVANSIISDAVKDGKKNLVQPESERYLKLVDDVAKDLTKSIPRYFWSDDPEDWSKGFFGKGVKENIIKYLEN